MYSMNVLAWLLTFFASLTSTAMHIKEKTVMMGHAHEFTGQGNYTGRSITITPRHTLQKNISTSGLAGCTALGIYILFKDKRQQAILMHQPFVEALIVELSLKKFTPSQIDTSHAIIYSPFKDKGSEEYIFSDKIRSLEQVIKQQLNVNTTLFRHGYNPYDPLPITRGLALQLHPDHRESSYTIEDGEWLSYLRTFNQ